MDQYRLMGSEMSPYSMKVRAWLQCSGLDFAWEPRGPHNNEEFQQRARLPLVPLLVTPQDENLQDSTPIIEELLLRHPQAGARPEDPGLDFLAWLLEEFADEWGNKWMFHLRWKTEEDQVSAARRLAAGMTGQEPPPQQMVDAICERMVPRVSFVGSNADTAPIIEQSYQQALQLLQAHLSAFPFLLGGRVSVADYALYGQLYNCGTDPTASAMLAKAPAVKAWIEAVACADPHDPAGYADWPQLAPTLQPLLREQVGGLFLPWSDANAKALQDGAETMECTLPDGRRWHQTPQKYHARSLAEIRGKYARLPADSWVHEALREAGCQEWLQA